MKPQYTVSRCRKDDTLYGSIHGSENTYETICGLSLETGDWWIETNNYDGEVTCKKCLNLLGEDRG